MDLLGPDRSPDVEIGRYGYFGADTDVDYWWMWRPIFGADVYS